MPATLPRSTASSLTRWVTRRPGHPKVVLASATSAQGERWSLRVQRTPAGLRTRLQITTPEGVLRPAGAAATLPLPPGQVVRVCSGRGASGPAWLVLRLRSDVRGVAVRLSDGSCQDVPLLAGTDRLPAGVAVLVYPRHLDVHRIDPYDAHGAPLDAFG